MSNLNCTNTQDWVVVIPEVTTGDAEMDAIIARMSETMRHENVAKAEYYSAKAEGVNAKIQRVRAKRRCKKSRKAFFQRNRRRWAVACGVVGFIIGLICAVDQLLLLHGPTVTLLGTVEATGLYLLAGLLDGACWYGFGRVVAGIAIRQYNDDIDSMDEELNKLFDEKVAFEEKAAQHRDLAS